MCWTLFLSPLKFNHSPLKNGCLEEDPASSWVCFGSLFFRGEFFHRSCLCPAANSTEGRIDDNITFDLERTVSPNTVKSGSWLGMQNEGWVTSRRLENGQWLGWPQPNPISMQLDHWKKGLQEPLWFFRKKSSTKGAEPESVDVWLENWVHKLKFYEGRPLLTSPNDFYSWKPHVTRFTNQHVLNLFLPTTGVFSRIWHRQEMENYLLAGRLHYDSSSFKRTIEGKGNGVKSSPNIWDKVGESCYKLKQLKDVSSTNG